MDSITNLLSQRLLSTVIVTIAAFASISYKPSIAVNDVFEGTSPCASAARSFLQIPAAEKCEFVKWHLTLDYDQQTSKHSNYTLTRSYLYYIDNSTSKSQGTVTIKGKWEITNSVSSLPHAIIYKLYHNSETLSFIKVDENLIHLLAPDNSFSAEASVESFTLSRTNAKPVGTAGTIKVSRPLANEKQSLIKFIGRSPCAEIGREINMPPRADCNKMKWLLKLYFEPSKQQPTVFELSATFHRQSIIKGRWEIVRGRPGDPDAIIYKLHLSKPYEPMFLLKGDDNVLFFVDKNLNPLVGNSNHSYTLSRQN